MTDPREKRIDGKALAARIEEGVRAETERLRARGVFPRLVSLAVKDAGAGFASYMRSRERACARVGIESVLETVPLQNAERELARAVMRLNEDRSVHGILLGLPFPSGVNEEVLFSLLDPEKDVEGQHPWNAGLLALGRPRFAPCTALAVLEILQEEGVPLEGTETVILGRSRVVGAPLASLLLRKGKGGDATVTVCHSRTRDLLHHIRQAEVLVAAVGRPEFVRGEWLRDGSVVIDVGTHAVEDPSAKKGWRMVGDVHYASAEPVASRITPVPGGVGPVTTAILLRATARAAAGREDG
ncbi:MAG: bifunctional 5,10-methylenetetrahydrofolate dehydrogenase/5,10-methenyltetrahydrofolate cyclohydrolase [Candidatus Eisenbacteria bacterium]|nr:bifunctional 5,10-methylenetetrahydrofolate dehydrogenase/5,10-methenyltetrahydrofolate cyclohydrolase [Candidatus Eisenbacteria bacterium]